jgi:NAD+ synthase (glutamine-hydrolysing)
VKEKKSPDQLIKILLSNQSQYSESDIKNYVAKFLRMFAINQWKRERIAPSFHLDDFNIDPRSWFRFPILNSTFGHEINQFK